MVSSDDPIPSRPTPAAMDADLLEVDAAVQLVAHGAARRVRLVGLNAPERVAAIALARAQEANLAFHADRAGASMSLTIGPRLGRP